MTCVGSKVSTIPCIFVMNGIKVAEAPLNRVPAIGESIQIGFQTWHTVYNVETVGFKYAITL
jgi:hypothetical protein